MSPAAVPSKVNPEKTTKELPSYVGQYCAGWKQIKWPTTAGEYKLNVGRAYTGGVYKNVPMPDGITLPKGSYHEYDVAADKTYGPTSRGKHRLVRNDKDGTVYYTSDHYDNFTPIKGGC